MKARWMIGVLAVCLGVWWGGQPERPVVTAQAQEAFTTDADGNTIFTPTGNAHTDAALLENFLETDEEKSLTIPAGTTVYVSQVVDIGSNTTIHAEGATIIQTENGKGVLAHVVDDGNYGAIENVVITGGTWKNAVNSETCTMFRFAHGSNLNFRNVTIETNFKSHGLAMVACRDCLVQGCTITAKNAQTKSNLSVEEALQIDVATPDTAPGILQETGRREYVNGQTCRNITVKNCRISGSRGVCANVNVANAKYRSKCHQNITIIGCHITGTSAEGIALLNVLGCRVKKNTVTSTSSRGNSYSDGIHFTLVGKEGKARKYTNVFANNTVRGKYYGLDVTTTHDNVRHGTVVLKHNKVFCKKGSARAIHAVHCRKLVMKKNQLRKY